jgi:enoyl-CoA hydratase/carnithine racemase
MSNLLVQQRGPILQITFNRPDKKNAVTPEMVVGLARA